MIGIELAPAGGLEAEADNTHLSDMLALTAHPYCSANAVKQVRDNLFRGGKAGEDPRDDQLCRAAWAVLAHGLEQQHDIKAMFEGHY